MKYLHYNTDRNTFGTFSTNWEKYRGWRMIGKETDKVINGFIWSIRDKYSHGLPGIDTIN